VARLWKPTKQASWCLSPKFEPSPSQPQISSITDWTNLVVGPSIFPGIYWIRVRINPAVAIRQQCGRVCVQARHEGKRDRDRLSRAAVVHFVSSTVLCKLSCLYIMPIIVKLFTCTRLNICVGVTVWGMGVGWGGERTRAVLANMYDWYRTHGERSIYEYCCCPPILLPYKKIYFHTCSHLIFQELGPLFLSRSWTDFEPLCTKEMWYEPLTLDGESAHLKGSTHTYI
jgi:hypothetical protein